MTILFVLGATVLGTVVLWPACGRLETSAHRLSLHYGIPEVVQGSVLLAISSSVPELATALLAFPVHDDFELGMSAIIGSAIYNILVIPAFSVFARKAPLRANKEIVYREAQFYLVSVASLMVVLGLAVIYNDNPLPSPVTESGRQIIEGEFTPLLAVMPLLLYGLYLFLQYEEVKDGRDAHPRQKGINAGREWAILAIMVVLILIGVELLLRVAITLADTLQTCPTRLSASGHRCWAGANRACPTCSEATSSTYSSRSLSP
jgi:cation:H+ antiporter